MNRHVQRLQYRQIPIHRVRIKRFAPHDDVIKPARALPRLVEPDKKPPVREPSKKPAAQETLQVNDEIKALLPHPSNAVPDFVPVGRGSPALALETNDSRQVRITI